MAEMKTSAEKRKMWRARKYAALLVVAEKAQAFVDLAEGWIEGRCDEGSPLRREWNALLQALQEVGDK